MASRVSRGGAGAGAGAGSGAGGAGGAADVTDGATATPSAAAPVRKTKHRKINKLHPEFELTYDMMLGIRTVVSKTEAQHRDALLPSDFTDTIKLRFPGRGSAMTPAHAMRDFKFKDYLPQVFRAVRHRFGINPADYLMCVCGNFQYLEFISNSKSGAFFFYSHDRQYMIKTISQPECKFLASILPAYYHHVMQNPHTLLTRFYGMHRVKPHKKKERHFLIMGSVFYTTKYIHQVFDLKGARQGRNATAAEIQRGNPIYKDNDFADSKMTLNLGTARAKLFEEQLNRDVEFLRKLNIIDYSLLVGIHYKDREVPAYYGRPDLSGTLQREYTRSGIGGHSLIRTDTKYNNNAAQGGAGAPNTATTPNGAAAAAAATAASLANPRPSTSQNVPTQSTPQQQQPSRQLQQTPQRSRHHHHRTQQQQEQQHGATTAFATSNIAEESVSTSDQHSESVSSVGSRHGLDDETAAILNESFAQPVVIGNAAATRTNGSSASAGAGSSALSIDAVHVDVAGANGESNGASSPGPRVVSAETLWRLNAEVAGANIPATSGGSVASAAAATSSSSSSSSAVAGNAAPADASAGVVQAPASAPPASPATPSSPNSLVARELDAATVASASSAAASSSAAPTAARKSLTIATDEPIPNSPAAASLTATSTSTSSTIATSTISTSSSTTTTAATATTATLAASSSATTFGTRPTTAPSKSPGAVLRRSPRHDSGTYSASALAPPDASLGVGAAAAAAAASSSSSSSTTSSITASASTLDRVRSLSVTDVHGGGGGGGGGVGASQVSPASALYGTGTSSNNLRPGTGPIPASLLAQLPPAVAAAAVAAAQEFVPPINYHVPKRYNQKSKPSDIAFFPPEFEPLPLPIDSPRGSLAQPIVLGATATGALPIVDGLALSPRVGGAMSATGPVDAAVAARLPASPGQSPRPRGPIFHMDAEDPPTTPNALLAPVQASTSPSRSGMVAGVAAPIPSPAKRTRSGDAGAVVDANGVPLAAPQLVASVSAPPVESVAVGARADGSVDAVESAGGDGGAVAAAVVPSTASAAAALAASAAAIDSLSSPALAATLSAAVADAVGAAGQATSSSTAVVATSTSSTVVAAVVDPASTAAAAASSSSSSSSSTGNATTILATTTGSAAAVAAAAAAAAATDEMILFNDHGGIGSVVIGDPTKLGNEIYFVGIIDILTQYGAKKYIENRFKGLFYDKREISAVSPRKYAERFKAFLQKALR